MKAKFLILALLLSVVSISVNAKGLIIYGNGEEVEKVKDLPDNSEYTLYADDGTAFYVDLGIRHEQFSLFWIPLWNYGTESYVLYTDKKIGNYDYTYYELSEEELNELRMKVGDIPATPELPFWNRIGGKLVLLLILGLLIYFKYVKNDD